VRQLVARYATPADLVVKRGPAAPADGDDDDAADSMAGVNTRLLFGST
jgi:hypothetical protein